MISYEEAYKIALVRISSNCEIVEDLILEKPYGWYFREQSKEYLKTKDIRHMLRGGESFIVEKENGRIVSFGSTFSLEDNFRYYEEGF
jgi:Immunity protein 35